MPVITRSQRKNIDNQMKENFISNITKLLALCDVVAGKENKMRICLEIFQKINQDLLNQYLPEVIEKTSVKMCYLAFTATVFNKTTEFLDDAKQGNWLNLDKHLVKKFNTELHKSRTLAMLIIKNNSAWFSNRHIMEAKKEIANLENTRVLRNIKRVDYRGMDMMEPEF